MCLFSKNVSQNTSSLVLPITQRMCLYSEYFPIILCFFFSINGFGTVKLHGIVSFSVPTDFQFNTEGKRKPFSHFSMYFEKIANTNKNK